MMSLPDQSPWSPHRSVALRILLTIHAIRNTFDLDVYTALTFRAKQGSLLAGCKNATGS